MPWTLGDRVKAARLALGLTQDELAKPDLSKSFISLLERDLARPSASTLERIAQRLGKSVSYFLGHAEAEFSYPTLNALNDRGRSELARQRYDTALATFSEMGTLVAVRHDDKMEMDTLVGRGEALAGLWRLHEAKNFLTEALGRARDAADALVECRALAGLGRVEHRSGNFPRAATLYEKVLTIAETLPSEVVLHGEIAYYRGTIFRRMGRLQESSEAYTRAQEIFEKAGLHEWTEEVLVSHSVALYLCGDYDGALLRLEKWQEYKDPKTLSWARNNLGVVLLEIDRPREALSHFCESLAIKQRVQDAVGECRTLTELARCHFACGDTESAREYGLRAIARCREVGVPDEEAQAQIILGRIAAASGDFRKAERYLLRAATACERASMTLELVTVPRELARVASLQGRHKEATMYHEKAFAVLRTMAPHDATAAVRMADLVAQDPRITASANRRRSSKE